MAVTSGGLDALEAVPANTVVLDTDGVIVYANRAWRTFGSANGLESDTVGQNYFEVCEGSEEGDEVERGIRSVITEDRDIYTFEYPCHSPTERRWFLMQAATFEADDERYVLVMHVDVTDRKLAELAARNQIERLEFVSGMLSSELRGSLRSAARVLAEHVDETGDEKLGAVLLGLERIGQVIEDIEGFATGDELGPTRQVELRRVAEQAWKARAPQRATLQTPDTRLLHAHPELLRALFDRVYQGAMDRGGPAVTVEVGPTRDGFYIADDSPGLSTREREGLFEPQYDDRDGVAMAIVRQLCLAHGWEVTVTSSPSGVRLDVTGI